MGRFGKFVLVIGLMVGSFLLSYLVSTTGKECCCNCEKCNPCDCCRCCDSCCNPHDKKGCCDAQGCCKTPLVMPKVCECSCEACKNGCVCGVKDQKPCGDPKCTCGK